MIKYVHIFPEPEEKKRKEKKGNRGHHNVPEIGGQLGKVPLKGGGYYLEKHVKGSVSFPQIYRGCPVIGNAHIGTPLNLHKWGGRGPGGGGWPGR